MERKNAWKTIGQEEQGSLEQLCREYRDFLNAGKTERECVRKTVELAKKAGFRDLAGVIARGETLKPSDAVYAVNMNKAVALFRLGRRPLEEGMRILGAHIDSPRMDVKQNPLYEDSDLAYLDTHYYGGIKKYQWVTIPLAIHGVVARKDGEVREIVVGEDPEDPVLCITDLLIHLASEQMGKKGSVVIEGENLDVLIGSRPAAGKDPAGKSEEQTASGDGAEEKKSSEKQAVKSALLEILKEKYGMEEEDFLSAELEIVPAGPARECGLDRSMIAAYGQDDRVCAFTSLKALLDTPVQEYTSCALLVDKEEIGSVGATGMHSRFFENTVAELLACQGGGASLELRLRRALQRCKMLSSDVSAGFDPLYASVFDKKNCAYLGRGLVFNKYTGSRGKSGSNDANAEYVAWIRRVMDESGTAWQTAELGRVDAGGGGTIAYISAVYNMDVIDSGVAVLSMHAPMELTSKVDIYQAKKGYEAFLKAAEGERHEGI